MLIELENVSLSNDSTCLLKDVNMMINEGEFVYILGKVGTGKSSLLKSFYGELPVSKGTIRILGMDLIKLKSKKLPKLRKQMGIIFQDFQLLRHFTIQDNLDFVLKATGWKRKKERLERISEVLNLVGLAEKRIQFPHELSGGEQQRVAIARAILNHPKIILADEPTGNLDMETAINIVQLLKNICENGTSVVMVTHNVELLKMFPGTVYALDETRQSLSKKDLEVYLSGKA